MDTVRKFARTALRALPDDGRLLKTSIRKLLVRKELAIGKLMQNFSGTNLPDPRTIYWLDPAKIEFATCLKNSSADWEDRVFPQKGHLKLVHDGEWDALSHRVADMRIFRAIDGRIKKGESWQSTDYYQVAVNQIEGGRNLWGCADRADFDKYCTDIDRLIESINRDGYRESAALSNESGMDSPLGHKEILINVSREGFPLFQDGRHRLAIASVLGLRKVPVQILVRHSEWQVFREFMHRMAHGSGGASKEGSLYQMPTHFDLGDIPAEHGCEDRWNAIAKHVPAATETALDIGCNLGFFCHRLEDLGYTCFGIEYFPDIAYAARRVSQAEKRRFKIVTGDILAEETLNGIGISDFGVVIALNIFHHFVKTEDGYTRLQKFMNRVRADTMFFEPHHPDEPQMRGAFSNPSPEEFAELIKRWGNFQSVSPIYSAGDGRTIYKLGR
jgi:SAM-dependent methyltransferase